MQHSGTGWRAWAESPDQLIQKPRIALGSGWQRLGTEELRRKYSAAQ